MAVAAEFSAAFTVWEVLVATLGEDSGSHPRKRQPAKGVKVECGGSCVEPSDNPCGRRPGSSLGRAAVCFQFSLSLKGTALEKNTASAVSPI